MSFTIGYDGAILQQASRTGRNRSYELPFKVHSQEDTDVSEVYKYLRSELATSWGGEGADAAKLDTFSCHPADPHNQKEFVGSAIYLKTNNSVIVNDRVVDDSTTVRFGENTYQKTILYSRNDKNEWVVVQNSAYQLYKNPLIETEKRLVIYIDKTYTHTEINPNDFEKYMDTVNLNAVQIVGLAIPARSAWIQTLSPTLRDKGGGNYDWRVSFTIEVKRWGEVYDRKVQDRGTNILEEVSADAEKWDVMAYGVKYNWVPVPVIDPKTGKRYETEDRPLNGEGGLLEDVSPGNEFYFTYRSKAEESWSYLRLPRTPSAAVSD